MNESNYINNEIEIKLDLQSFINYLKLIGFLGKIEHEEQHLNVFFDTEDRQISSNGWALRVRAENSRGLVTIKSLPSEQGLAIVRQEIETEISRGDALDIINLQKDVMELKIMPIEYIIGKIGQQPLTRLVKFDNTRQKKVFKLGDSNYILEIDKTEYSDGSVDYELEMELKNTDSLEVLEDHLRKLFASLDIPFILKVKSKFHRALEKAKII